MHIIEITEIPLRPSYDSLPEHILAFVLHTAILVGGTSVSLLSTSHHELIATVEAEDLKTIDLLELHGVRDGALLKLMVSALGPNTQVLHPAGRFAARWSYMPRTEANEAFPVDTDLLTVRLLSLCPLGETRVSK